MAKGIKRVKDQFFIDGQGFVMTGHTATATQARTAAQKWLTDNGTDALKAQMATETAHVGRAWYANDTVGFVNPDHPERKAVTVVNVAMDSPGG